MNPTSRTLDTLRTGLLVGAALIAGLFALPVLWCDPSTLSQALGVYQALAMALIAMAGGVAGVYGARHITGRIPTTAMMERGIASGVAVRPGPTILPDEV